MPGQPGRRHAPFFYVAPAALAADVFTLGSDDARHLALVRRAAPGDVVVACDGQGSVADARLVAVGPKSVQAEVTSRSFAPAPRPRVVVYQGLAKGDKVDAALRQLVELGVDRVVLFAAGRSVARWDTGKEKAAASRWAGIALQAAKQSHRRWLPEVAGPMTLAEAAADASAGRMSAASAGDASPRDSSPRDASPREASPREASPREASPRDASGGDASAGDARDARRGGKLGLVAQPGAPRSLAELIGPDGAELSSCIWVVVGPEGGLEPKEVAAFEAAGAHPVTLGDQILRTETAAPAIAAALMYRFGRFGN